MNGGTRLDAWLWLDVSFILFFGAGCGLLAWAAIFRIARAGWAAAVVRLGHSAILFTPVLFAALVGLLLGAREFVPWADHPVPGKEAWLNVPFMAWRNIVLCVILWFLCAMMVHWSLRADRSEEVTAGEHYRLTGISVAVVLAYVVSASIVAFDFIMSLSPNWISTMFAPYYWVTNLYLAMAVLVLVSAVIQRNEGARGHLGPQQFQDMGNLLLAFSLFSMGLFFAQYLTIWYSNLPMETGFLIVRYLRGSWPCLGWTAFGVGYALPFVLLQSRILKRNPTAMSCVSVLIILGAALERYVLVVPSMLPRKLMLAPSGSLMLLGFLGVFVLGINRFLKRNPLVSQAQAALQEVDQTEVAS